VTAYFAALYHYPFDEITPTFSDQLGDAGSFTILREDEVRPGLASGFRDAALPLASRIQLTGLATVPTKASRLPNRCGIDSDRAALRVAPAARATATIESVNNCIFPFVSAGSRAIRPGFASSRGATIRTVALLNAA